jgi:hypothetical protein
MKALKILKYIKEKQDISFVSNSNINEAIEELEALKNKDCNNCKHWELGWCFKLGSSLNIGGCGDYWEQK